MELAPSSPQINHKFPVLFSGQMLVITTREKEFIDSFIYLQDVKAAADKSGLTEKYAKDFLKNPRFQEYVKYKISEVANKNSITLEGVLLRLSEIAFGRIKVSKMELDALKVLAEFVKITKPKQSNTLVVNQNNPISQMDDESLNKMLEERGIKIGELSKPQGEGADSRCGGQEKVP